MNISYIRAAFSCGDKCIQCETIMKDTKDKDMPYEATFADFSFPDCCFHLLNKYFVVTFYGNKDMCRTNEEKTTTMCLFLLECKTSTELLFTPKNGIFTRSLPL